MAQGGDPLRLALGRALVRRARRPADRLSAAPRPGPSDPAQRAQLPRQHRRPEALGRHRDPVALRRGLAPRGAGARQLRLRRPVHRPHLRPPQELLRDRHGGPRGLRPSGLRPPGRSPGGRRAQARHRPHPRRHLSGHGGPPVLHHCRIRALPELGLPGDRHDQHARGQARPRGGDLLRNRGHGDRFRLLAPGPRPCHRRSGDRRAARQRGQRPGPGQGGRAPAGRARCGLPPRLPPGPGQRAHHPAPGARPPGPGPARRRGRPRAGRLCIGARP